MPDTSNPVSASRIKKIYNSPRRIIVERRIFRLQPGDRLYLGDHYSQDQDGSFHLQPNKRLS